MRVTAATRARDRVVPADHAAGDRRRSDLVGSGCGGRGLAAGGAGGDARDEQSEQETADVREERHAAACRSRRDQAEVALDELVEEPDKGIMGSGPG